MSAGTLAEVFRAHRATVGPVTGAWYCSCGAASTKGSIRDGDLTSRSEREAQWDAHLVAVIAVWLTEDAQTTRAAGAVLDQLGTTGDPHQFANRCARAALAAITEEGS